LVLGVYFLVALAGALLFAFPVFWLVSLALKKSSDIFSANPALFPIPPQWHNIPDALTSSALNDNFLVYIRNSLVYTLLEVIGDTFVAAIVAYGFARLRSRASGVLFAVMMATIMVPFQATLLPQVILFKALGWFNTPLPLIVPTYFGTAFNIFLLRQFFRGIPTELDEAATVDGLNYPGIFLRIILPLSVPALMAAAVFSFVYHWNDLLAPLIYLNTSSKFPVAVALTQFQGAYGLTSWNLLMAVALVACLPCLILFFVAQRYFIQGIVVTGVKG
jgi:multiple sugar transport system permease protein